ncbi:T-complex protein 11-like protein 1 [Dissostichus eleginoides]|uniref:T-complex protein 11-like protein 1 n=1 Tax=Dissostichus eleginoides TaxID=100907 RepID=A0AAD9F6M0_DISEL|nr:T-complex protein 11-like protein 1 [Dissostichus eleginoides]
MSSIKERAAALNLADKLCVRPQAPGVASKPVQSSSMWSSLLSHLRSSVTVKRRRVHLKSHSDCFLGSEAVDVLTEHISCGKAFEGADVTRDKVVCVCQALLDCNVFKAVGTKVFGKDKKQDVFQDSKSVLYRFVVVCSPSVDELEKGVLVNGIKRLFCSAPTDRQEGQTCPSGPHIQFSTPVKCTQTFLQAEQHLSPAAGSLSLGPQMDTLTPCRLHNDTALPQSLVDEIWQEQTLLRLLNLVELPLLEGVLQWCQTPAPPSPSNLLPRSNPNLIYSSNHLDRQILRAFRDSQEDEWLGAALDCLDFLPDQPVVELSRELPHCKPQHQDSSEHGSSSDEQPRLSLSGVAQCKLLLYGTLVKHYSHTDRPPLMPPHMTDIYTAITDLLVNAELNMALEALQLCLKLLPPGCRDQLRKVLTFMALAADPQGIKLDKEMENRQAVKRSFFRAMLHSRVLSKDKEDLMVVFMLSNIKEMFKIPGALHKVVSEKLASLVQGEQPDVTGLTFCQQVSRRTHSDSTKETTNQALWTLLNSIHQDPKSMQKENDQVGGDKESKEERTQPATEGTVSKRIRANTPSPQRGNTPQASPPKIVSVEELMETAKGVSNMVLAHEIIVNSEFQVKPAAPPEGSLEHKVKEIVHKAFWECLEAQLTEEPQTYGHLIKLLEEIKETLLSFVMPLNVRLLTQIEEVLDLPLIQQQAEKGAVDIGQLSQFIVMMMGSQCAPCRDGDIRKLKEITEIVPLLKAIFSVLDLMKVDMANFALTSLRPHLMQHSVEYERSKFQEFVEKQPNALDFTEKWLEDTVRSLRETDGSTAASSDPPAPLSAVNVHNKAYIRLLKWDHASDPFPETILMDQVRFQEMYQEAERLVLLSSVLLIIYTTTGEAISGLPGLMDTLKNTVSALLADMNTPSFNAEEALATIGEKMCVELSKCLSQHGYSPYAPDRKSILKGQISATILPGNTIRKLMESRVQSYLLASLDSNQHNAPPPLPGGLAPVSKEVKELAVRFSRLVNFNKLVFSPFYQKIFSKVLTSEESPGAET